MSKCLACLSRTFIVPAVLFVLVVGGVNAAETETETPQRESIRDQRPDDSRGWVVISKASYWPLCYESLDRIEEARKLIGSGDHEQIAEIFDKCGAWLNLAASAAMTDGNSGVADSAIAFQEAAESLRAGSSDWSQDELSDLTTLGLLSMAKSHVLRAASFDEEFKIRRASKASTNPSVELKAAEAQIRVANRELGEAQYAHDALEAQRHLKVAQIYVRAAAKAGNFSVDETFLVAVPDFKEDKYIDMVEYFDDEIRGRIKAMNVLLAGHHKTLKAKLDGQL